MIFLIYFVLDIKSMLIKGLLVGLLFGGLIVFGLVLLLLFDLLKYGNGVSVYSDKSVYSDEIDNKVFLYWVVFMDDSYCCDKLGKLLMGMDLVFVYVNDDVIFVKSNECLFGIVMILLNVQYNIGVKVVFVIIGIF